MDSLRTFISTTHPTLKTPYNMPNPELTSEQTDAVVAYVMRPKKQQDHGTARKSKIR